jgi:hypothetical protein
MSVGDGLIQPNENRAMPSIIVSITPFMFGDFFRKLPHPLETLMKDSPTVDGSDKMCCILFVVQR